MTAETDIAAIDDGGLNTATEVRTAMTSILARADASSGAKISDPAGADQAVGITTDTPVTFDTVDFDDDGYADLGTNNDRLTMTTAGIYVVGGTIVYASSSGVWYDARISLNGSLYDLTRQYMGASQSKFIQVITVVNASANDYVELVAHNSDGADVVHTAFGPHLWLVKL